MRHGRHRTGYAMLTAVAGLALVAGCTDNPPVNDLNPRPTTATPSPPPPPPSAPPGPGIAPGEPNPNGGPVPQPKPASQDRSGALTSADLAAEGVTAARADAPLDACAASALGTPPETSRWAWRYPSGALLLQYLAPSATVTRTAPCGHPLRLPPLPGVDRQTAWCLRGCALTVVRDGRASVLEVRATTVPKAAAAIERLAPVTARRLHTG